MAGYEHYEGAEGYFGNQQNSYPHSLGRGRGRATHSQTGQFSWQMPTSGQNTEYQYSDDGGSANISPPGEYPYDPVHQVEDGPNRKNLIINYLPQYITDRDLSSLFCRFGKIESARVMKDRKTGYSFGFGFVNYSQEIEAARAIDEMNGLHMDNKVLKVSIARPPSEEIKDTNLYVSNLRRDITDAELKDLFSRFGEIVHQHILQDKYTGLPRGVAFVRFARREQANAALLSMNNFTPDGSTEALRVKIAENHGKQKAMYLAGFQAGYNQGGTGRYNS